MNLPDARQWLRVEELGEELAKLPSTEAALRISHLAREGESPTVLTLLGNWMSLPAPPVPLSRDSVVGGRYRLREKLGEGGMGSVWRARQEMIGRDVALKMIHPALVTPALRARFLAEIELLGQLNHPGIVKIFDAGVEEREEGPALLFFAMELVEGWRLDRWAGRHRGDRPRLLRAAAAICSAVQSAHDRLIVHRDLKPGNILVRNDGEPVVLDFGIARLAGVAAGEEPGFFSGTPQYAAPEQHLGRDQDFRSGESVDVYAVGALVFEMLTGRRLFRFPRGLSLSEMRRIVLEEPLPRLSNTLPDCPPFLDEIVSRAIRRDPADRFFSIAALGRALRRAAEVAAPGGSPCPEWRPAAGALIPGTQWKLTERLGEGGVGDVWLGIHEQMAERRVFKFCNSDETARTLKREMTLFRLLKDRVGRHPHFLQLHEVSLDEPPWYLMMDYEEAKDLEAWCLQQPGGLEGMPEPDRLEIVAQAAEALQAAHEAGILHRDIKPANLLVKSDAASGKIHVFVADFGIGQIVADELLRGGTRLGFTRTVRNMRRDPLSGTLLYIAPEVLEGHPATARSDIYSLGVVLWQLLTGNLNAALDPAEWPVLIRDELLREDLSRCLAGAPHKRWNSAGELAAQLRALGQRRTAEARRQAERAASERAAYRRGVLGAAAVALAVVAAVAGLAWVALIQRRQAVEARGEIALQQAASLSQTDLGAGRRERGINLLDAAAATVTNRAALRTAAASVLGAPDLLQIPALSRKFPFAPLDEIARKPGETCRAFSGDGRTLAIARDLDGLNGAVDLIVVSGGKPHLTLTREQFPWMPVPEAGLLRFSPDGRQLAVGGAKTSRHLLIFDLPEGSLHSYLFQRADPFACAWHPAGRVLATGSADGLVRLWDTSVRAASRKPTEDAEALPPSLAARAFDRPALTLRGHRGPVEQLAFSTDGRWLASLDRLGYLRVYEGFPSQAYRELFRPASGPEMMPDPGLFDPSLVVEVRLERTEDILDLTVIENSVVIVRMDGQTEAYELIPGDLPAESFVGSGLVETAWNPDATQLCAITLTDIHWLDAWPPELYCSARGKNPVGVAPSGADGYWMIPSENRLVARRPLLRGDAWTEEEGPAFELTAALEGQGTRTAMAATADGRLAIYRGRRVQFFAGPRAAPLDASLIADSGGVFRDVLWDRAGRLLGVVFALDAERLRLESWETSSEFPPRARPLASSHLESQRIVPAHDSKRFITRGARRGLCFFEPSTGKETLLDASNIARQDAPLAASPGGKFLAMVADRNVIRLLRLPQGTLFADLPSRRPAGLTALAWDASGKRLASLTEDGFLQTWNLLPWLELIARWKLEN